MVSQPNPPTHQTSLREFANWPVLPPCATDDFATPNYIGLKDIDLPYAERWVRRALKWRAAPGKYRSPRPFNPPSRRGWITAERYEGPSTLGLVRDAPNLPLRLNQVPWQHWQRLTKALRHRLLAEEKRLARRLPAGHPARAWAMPPAPPKEPTASATEPLTVPVTPEAPATTAEV